MFNRQEGEFIIEEMTRYKMASVEEYEHVHGLAEVELQIGIMKLKRTCVTDSPYTRLVVTLVASVDTAHNILIDSHVAMVKKMNAQLS